jgi:hypothetical protein
MFQLDPWEKAADCERARGLASDSVHRRQLASIRESWISLARKQAFMSEGEFANEAEAIGRLHSTLTAAPAMH